MPMGKAKAIKNPGITPNFSGVLNLDKIMAGITMLNRMFSKGFSLALVFGLLMVYYLYN
jgi:hypothetical protein